ncbi:putative uncharacterized protein DDB_G0282133 [Anopheles coustani]|uniref:putative uncharacterized protein DDB_G0282133 n=1 Tax=Anopheles coustani TaxID=139045 RepID=UPI002659FCED|nr:putative uncharacterized protein DDB_G0282133 [Anopheles coustani]
MERTGETCPWKEIRNHFKRHIIFHLNNYTGDLETINRLQYPYLQKLNKVQIHFTDNGPKPPNATSVMHNKLFIKYIMDGRYDSDVQEAFKRCSSEAKKIININVKDPAYALTESVQQYLLKVKKPAGTICRECAEKLPESAEGEAPNELATVSQSTNVSPLQPSPVMLDGIPIEIENCSAPISNTFTPNDLLENESLNVNTQQFKEILLQLSQTRNVPIEEIILENSISYNATIKQFSQADPLESVMELIHGNIDTRENQETQIAESEECNPANNTSILEYNSAGRNSNTATSFNEAPASCVASFSNTAEELINDSYLANVSIPDQIIVLSDDEIDEGEHTMQSKSKPNEILIITVSDDEVNEDEAEEHEIGTNSKTSEIHHLPFEDQTTNDANATYNNTILSATGYPTCYDPPIHNTPEESSHRSLANISNPDCLRLSDDDMNEDNEEEPTIAPNSKTNEINCLPVEDQTTNDGVDTNANSILSVAGDPTSCHSPIHNTPGESTSNCSLPNISIPECLRLSDDDMNEDDEEEPIIVPRSKPKEINRLPVEDQTTNDAVDTNGNTILSVAGDPTSCDSSIHNTLEEMASNRGLANIYISDHLRFSDDEMNEHDEEEPIISSNSKPNEIDNLPVEDQTTVIANESYNKTVPSASGDPTSCNASIHNTPEESTSNCSLPNISIPECLRLSDDDMNEDDEEEPIIVPRSKPKEINRRLPVEDQTTNDGVDTNGNTILSVAGDPTSCDSSIHNTPEESTSNCSLPNISIPECLRLSDDEMNEDDEEEPIIVPRSKQNEIPNTVEESASNRCLGNISIPDHFLALSDDELNEHNEELTTVSNSKPLNNLPAVQTTCDAPIQNTPEESTSNRCLANICLPGHLLALSEDEMNDDNEEESSIGNIG